MQIPREGVPDGIPGGDVQGFPDEGLRRFEVPLPDPDAGERYAARTGAAAHTAKGHTWLRVTTTLHAAAADFRVAGVEYDFPSLAA